MSNISDLAAALSDPGDPTAGLRIGLITEINASGKVRTEQTDTAWLARDQDSYLTVGDRVWMVKQGATWLVAGRLSGGLTVPVAKRKAASQSVTSSITLVNDTSLFYVLPIGMYRVQLVAHYTSAAALADIRSAWTFSGTAVSGGRSCVGPGSVTDAVAGTSTSSVMRSSGHNIDTEVIYGTDAGITTGALQEDLLLAVSVAGTLRWQWAQGASNPNGTSVSVASRLYVTPCLIV